MQLAIMIEGQNGLNWPRWQRIARLVEDLGFAGLHRSDHFTNGSPPNRDSLELWLSLTWLACNTRRIDFGPLVSPVSFRDPVFTARMALQVDDLSGGRLRLGLGAGWQEREHEMFGYALLDLPQRFQRFREGLEVIRLLMRSEQPVDFEGQYYHLRQAQLLPRPQRPGGPSIVIGGNGLHYTLPLVAAQADEWNAVDIPVERFEQLNSHLDQLIAASQRDPRSVRRTLMTSLIFASDDATLRARLGQRDPQSLYERGTLFGTPAALIDQLLRLEAAGLERVMLRWLDLDDLAGLEALARDVLPHVQRGGER